MKFVKVVGRTEIARFRVISAIAFLDVYLEAWIDKLELWGHEQCSADLINAAKRLRK